MSYSDRLRGLNNAFKTAQPYGVRLPDGVYQARVKTAVVHEFEKMESRPLTWTLECEVITPEKFAGRTLVHRVFLESPQYQQEAANRLLTEMNRLGVDLKGDMGNLEKLCKKLPGMIIEFAVAARKSDPRYSNSYINGVVHRDDKASTNSKAVTDDEAEAEVEEEVEIEEAPAPTTPARKKPKPAPAKVEKEVEEEDADAFEFEL